MAIVSRAVGVETGGSNIQFAINPADGAMIVVEMNRANLKKFPRHWRPKPRDINRKTRRETGGGIYAG